MLRKIRNLTHLGIAIAALPACSTGADRPEVPGCRATDCISIGQTQQAWHDLAVTPMEVLEDSRCPIEAECVWAGRVRLKARLDMGHESISADLDNSEPMRINGGFLSITEIAPDMSSAWSPIRQQDYRFAFRFVPDIMEEPSRSAK